MRGDKNRTKVIALKNCILYDWQNKNIIFPTETTECILNKEGYLQIVFK